MPTPVVTQGTAFKTGLMTEPSEPVALLVPFNFALDAAQVLTKDFLQEEAAQKIPYIQCVYIDNSGDANALTLAINGGDQQSITVKGRTQGYYPIAFPEGPCTITVTSTGSAIIKNILFLSMIVPPAQWATA